MAFRASAPEKNKNYSQRESPSSKERCLEIRWPLKVK